MNHAVPAELPKDMATARPSLRAARFLGIRLLMYAALLSTSSVLGSVHWTLELFSHFLPLYLFMSVVGTALTCFGRSWRWGAAGAVGSILLAGLVFSPPGASVHQDVTPHLKVIQANVLSSNRQEGPFLAFVRAEKPDVLSVQEVDGRWARILESLRPEYPFQHVVPESGNFGIALLSKFPLTNAQTIYPDGGSIPAISATMEFRGKSIEALAIHATPPVAGMASVRNRQLDFVHDWAAARQGMTLIVGDLNCTPWSPAWRKMLAGTGLVSARRRFSILGTWPAESPARIPIDHVLIKGGLDTVRAEVGSSINSDHLPLIVELNVM